MSHMGNRSNLGRGASVVTWLLLASCASTPPVFTTAAEVYDATKVDTDTFTKTETLDSPMVGERRESGDGAGWHLRGVRSTSGGKREALAVLRLHAYSKNWRFFETAWLKDGRRVRVERTDSNVNPYGLCLCEEFYTVWVSRQDLDRAAREGLVLKVEGRRGEQVVSLPAYVVTGFLAKMDGAARPNDASPAGPSR